MTDSLCGREMMGLMERMVFLAVLGFKATLGNRAHLVQLDNLDLRYEDIQS